MDHHQGRRILFELYRAAIDAVNGKTIVENYLQQNPLSGNIYIVAIGKAATAMMQGALQEISTHDGCTLTGALLITKEGHSPQKPLLSNSHYNSSHDSFIEVIESAHPIPDQRSLEAGKSLIEALQNMPNSSHLLLLVSGGASSLVEVLSDTVSLRELQQLNQWLLASAQPINEMNKFRRQISLIKQGGLLHFINAKQTTALYISDVAGNSPKVIGSGLLSKVQDGKIDLQQYRSSPQEQNDTVDPKASLIEQSNQSQDSNLECSENIHTAANQTLKHIPETIFKILDKGQKALYQSNRDDNTNTNGSDACTVRHKVLASLAHALLAASELTVKKGLVLNYIPDLYGEFKSSAKTIAARLKTMSPGVLIAGGEVTVELPESPGQGGRCQSLALAMAIEIAGDNNITFMAIGTDGTDGPGNDAGAMVDGETCDRGLIQGLQAIDYLTRADAGTFLEATGDLISTGPTGTNVMDLYIAIKF